MRYGVRLLVATALIVPFGLVAAHGAGAAAAGTKCKVVKGTATFNPALPKLGAGTTVKPKITLSDSSASKCKGGGVKSAVLTGTQKFHDKTSCDILLGGGPPGPHPPTGTITAKWDTGDSSKINVTLNPVPDEATKTHITGTVASGPFAGLTLDSTVSFAPKTGDCVSTDLSQVTFTQDSPLVIS
jgi:hypothetical protein